MQLKEVSGVSIKSLNEQAFGEKIDGIDFDPREKSNILVIEIYDLILSYLKL